MINDPHLIEDSFAKVASGNQQQFIQDFYARLMLVDSRMPSYFVGVDMPMLRQKLLLALVLVVDNLENPAKFRDTLGDLGQKHLKDYNVPTDVVILFVDPLIETLKDYLKQDWTPELELAWREALTVVVHYMQAWSSQ
ncbi:MAG: globin domain-containing protein [Phototrophicaceae bacterium]|jgi:hemoglobin-like flavoprotein